VAVDKKATDVVLLDIHELTIIADYFVICTGSNPRLLSAIADSIDEKMGDVGVQLVRREGKAESGWILLDFGDVICHIFGPVEREFYRLERLWSAAPRLLYVE
jgi:ribosome-associated protein